ncbi:MAG: glycerol-3-phosphate 1-O-acyltransferase PlsY [Candidatus Koribacter versatilis]|uniref:Glycerol-3-phosphate acyltransferase n=1 Tax=Candidatus Korobacter versatilis TaxID=658062 RepID=A0A932A8A0_9BACT|nr:glycerol-3-phosphate 1-O-acyltransferase PlsY [Candidatus Koribacter versatilis]
MTTYLIIALVSYLLGSIPFGYILVRIFLKQDIRATGSGNIGATNVGRTGHKGLAIATLILDALKGAAAVIVALLQPEALAWAQLYADTRMTDPTPPPFPASVLVGASLAGLCAVLGHMFPPWLRFRGGKGVATGVGAFLLLAPKAVGVALLLFLLIIAVTRYVSLGSMVAAALFPVFAWIFGSSEYPPIVVVFMGVTTLLIILKHHANIRRLIAGTESKLGAKPNIPPPQQMEKQA